MGDSDIPSQNDHTDQSVSEPPLQFENRKKDHIRLALSSSTQAEGMSGLSQVRLLHEALPELDFQDINLGCDFFGERSASPLFISSMTAGHTGSLDLNLILARVAERRGWCLGVGSQRRELFDSTAHQEWIRIRKACPDVLLMGNIGLSQIIRTKPSEIQRLVEAMQAVAIFVHTNPLQECLQPEGTPLFKGGYEALEALVKCLGVPVVLKETGCGFSKKTLSRLVGIGLSAVDISGLGGTHWGRIEGARSPRNSVLERAAVTFQNWGSSTVASMLAAHELDTDYAVWASGGVRSGLDAAKLFALGAEKVGLAQPILVAAMNGDEALDFELQRLEFELKTALFCTGCRSIDELQERQLWQWDKN